MPVNDIVDSLRWPQPMVSKHLGVLREVGLVSVREDGRQRLLPDQRRSAQTRVRLGQDVSNASGRVSSIASKQRAEAKAREQAEAKKHQQQKKENES
jgi:DNA-binding transcriptional ArsR family regulator